MAWYKYMRLKRFASVRDGLIRFTPPGAFNDPFEMPAFKAAEAEAMRAGLAGLTSQTQDIMAGLMRGQIPAAAWTPAMAYWQGLAGTQTERTKLAVPSRSAIERLRHIDRTFGILSLSCSSDNLLLWAHYADEHRGLAIEIDVEDEAFAHPADGRDSPQFQLAEAMRYSPERPRIPESEEILFDHFFVKSEEWAYEQEFRIVRRLASCAAKMAGRPHPIHLFPLPPTAIRRVIFGARVAEKDRTRIIAGTRGTPRFAHVRFALAKISPQAFRLDLIELPASSHAIVAGASAAHTIPEPSLTVSGPGGSSRVGIHRPTDSRQRAG
jgi:Protein of unknown function (DUF2971)